MNKCGGCDVPSVALFFYRCLTSQALHLAFHEYFLTFLSRVHRQGNMCRDEFRVSQLKLNNADAKDFVRSPVSLMGA